MKVLGLRDIASKSGQDVLNNLKVILQDIQEVSETADETAQKILLNTSCTMSDRASTQIKFNELLEDYHRDILPLTVENYIV